MKRYSKIHVLRFNLEKQGEIPSPEAVSVKTPAEGKVTQVTGKSSECDKLWCLSRQMAKTNHSLEAHREHMWLFFALCPFVETFSEHFQQSGPSFGPSIFSSFDTRSYCLYSWVWITKRDFTAYLNQITPKTYELRPNMFQPNIPVHHIWSEKVLIWREMSQLLAPKLVILLIQVITYM